MNTPNDPPSPRCYGRRKGRPLHVRKSALMRELLPRLEITLPSDLSRLFAATPRALWLEIGFGGGEHLAAQAAAHPDIGFVGCEPFVNGVASLLDHVDRMNLANVRVFPNDARLLLDALPNASLDRCFVLYADPWPKKRHAERRFIGPENLSRLARVLRAGGEVRLATDVPLLADWMRARAAEQPAFACLHDSPAPPPDWIPTRYEQKGLAAGRSPTYLSYQKKADLTNA